MKWPFQYWIGWASALLVVVYFLAFGIGLLLCSCTTAHLPKPTKPLKVEITAMPVREVTCWMPEIPRAPELRDADYDDEDVMRRVMVHRLDWAMQNTRTSRVRVARVLDAMESKDPALVAELRKQLLGVA